MLYKLNTNCKMYVLRVKLVICLWRNILKKLINIVFFLFVIVAFFALTKKVDALEVVYPRRDNSTIKAKSTFLVGNIGKDKTLLINGQPVKTYKDGAFVHVVPLEYGDNNFELKSVSRDNKVSVLNYKIIRPKPVPPTEVCTNKKTPIPIEEFSDYVIAEVVKNNSPLRDGASDNANRVSHLDKQTMLVLDAKKGEYYRVYADKNTKYWIKNGYFTEISRASEPFSACLRKFKYTYDKKYEYFKFKTDMAVPYKMKETDCGVDVTFYYVSSVPENLEKYVQNIKIENNILSFSIPHEKLWGYDCYYDGSYMVFRLTRAVKIDTHHPLKNIVIAIDPGHGGYDSGAIGPTKLREADIVLDIAKRLEKILENEEAKPILTRNGDDYVDLYKRVEIIKAADPLFSISIHANALPDGANPYVKHGTSVYYYYPQAKELAQVIKDRMIFALDTRDDGTLYSSFVLTRMTSPISILAEVAYMINPMDYEKLSEEQKRQAIAQSIADGLKAYMHASVPK